MKFENIPETNIIEIRGQKLQYDNEGMVKLGWVAGLLNDQCQYVSEFVTGYVPRVPKLAEDLRISGGKMGYHTLKIHKDDIETFVDRVIEYRKSIGQLD